MALDTPPAVKGVPRDNVAKVVKRVIADGDIKWISIEFDHNEDGEDLFLFEVADLGSLRAALARDRDDFIDHDL